MENIVVWFIATVLLVAALILGRRTQLQRKLRLGDIDWKAAVIFAAVIALIPTFIVSQLSRSTADVPESVADEKSITIGVMKNK